MIINEPPSVTPPPAPRFQPFHGMVANLQSGRRADVFSEPYGMRQDEPYGMRQDVIGTLCTGASPYIDCAVETTPVQGSSARDLIT